MGILIRRWSDGAEYEVATIEDFTRVYGDGSYYIPFGEFATHTMRGETIPTKKTSARTRSPKVEKSNENITTDQETTEVDDRPSGDEST